MIYADYGATTPLHPQALEAMMPYLTDLFYNASSLYPKAQQSRKALEAARGQLAALLGATPPEILFTAGGTESDNLAIKGVLEHMPSHKNHIITTATEHHAVLNVCNYLQTKGYRVTVLPVQPNGLLSQTTLQGAIGEDTALVSVLYVNNETGAVQDIPSLAAIAHKAGALFHTDAVQAFCTQEMDVAALGADLLSLSAHKFYGPKGVGLLYCKAGVQLSPQMQGGQQEGGLRGGTEAVAQIVGMATAAQLAHNTRAQTATRLRQCKRDILAALTPLEGVLCNSPLETSAPSVLNLGFKGVEAEGLLLKLAMEGIMLSMGAACNSQTIEPSHVLQAMAVPEEYIRGCIRITMGEGFTSEDAQGLATALLRLVPTMRRQTE